MFSLRRLVSVAYQGKVFDYLFQAIIVLLAILVVVHADPSGTTSLARLPRERVDTEYVAPRGRTIEVKSGGNFQAALAAARPGDVITLQAGATYTGPYTLPVKPGKDWIIIRSSSPEGKPPPAWRRWTNGTAPPDSVPTGLPPPGYRVDPSYAALMPQLVARDVPVIVAAPGAHHYRFIGIDIHPSDTPGSVAHRTLRSIQRWKKGEDATEHRSTWQTLVSLGANDAPVDKLSHHIIFDRCYLHGDPQTGTLRGIALNSSDSAVIDSYLADFMVVGADSQAIAGWNGPGPFKIENNYLEGAGENLMFGGADPSTPGLVPADIEIRGTYFAKPLSWRIGSADYAGKPWSVKNLLELKNARRVLIEGNLFEYSWLHAQTGFAVLLTVRNQDNAAPWSAVEDVTLTNNVMRHVGGGVDILGHDNNHTSQQTRRILIKNNLFEDVSGAWGSGLLFQLLDGTADVVIEHNTALQTDSIVQAGDNRAHTGFVFSDNIVLHNKYGIIGSGYGIGQPSIEHYFPAAIIRGNVIVGGASAVYPSGNFFPTSVQHVGFADAAAGDYQLTATSRYLHAAAGKTGIGVDFHALQAAMGAGWAEAVTRDRAKRYGENPPKLTHSPSE